MPPSAAEYWLASWSLNGVLTALSCTGLLPRRAPGYLSGAWLVTVVILVPREERMMSAVACLAALFYFVKTREQAVEDRFLREWWVMRVLGVIGTFHDVQERTPARPWVWPRLREVAEEVLVMMLHVGGMLVSREVVLRHTEVGGGDESLALAVACVASCMFAFFALNVYGDVLSLIWVVIGGFRLPLLMDHPEYSLSVREFWTRWDVVIQKLLRKYVFMTLREHGVGSSAAGLATFIASGFLHVYPIFVALGPEEWRSSAQMMTYFLVQFACMWVEGSFLHIKSWTSAWARRAWVLVCLFGPSYVLVMPVLRLTGIY